MHINPQIFETVMLVCFGSSWPFAVIKSIKTKTVTGKSIIFLYLIFAGYISGITYKLSYNIDLVICLYIFNVSLVFTEIILYHRYNKKKVYMDKLSAPKELETNHIVSIYQPQIDGRLSDKAISLNLERCPQCKKFLFKKKNGALFCPNECDGHSRRTAFNTVMDPMKDRRCDIDPIRGESAWRLFLRPLSDPLFSSNQSQV